jgi:hypothetical protein
MSLELLRSLDPVAAPAKGAVRLRPTVPGDAAMATLDERVGQSFDAVVRTETNASSADASPRHASPLEAPAQEGRPRVAAPRAGSLCNVDWL